MLPADPAAAGLGSIVVEAVEEEGDGRETAVAIEEGIVISSSAIDGTRHSAMKGAENAIAIGGIAKVLGAGGLHLEEDRQSVAIFETQGTRGMPLLESTQIVRGGSRGMAPSRLARPTTPIHLSGPHHIEAGLMPADVAAGVETGTVGEAGLSTKSETVRGTAPV